MFNYDHTHEGEDQEKEMWPKKEGKRKEQTKKRKQNSM